MQANPKAGDIRSGRIPPMKHHIQGAGLMFFKVTDPIQRLCKGGTPRKSVGSPARRLPRFMRCCGVLLLVLWYQVLDAPSQQAPSSVPMFKTTSTLVFLDVTVLDKKGNAVVSGLTKDDFTITEDKKPQRIFSFEAPQTHVMGESSRDNNANGSSPVTVFVLDQLNSSFEDFAYIRYEVRRFLMKQPEHLTSPAEMMVIGNQSLELIQGFTQSRSDLLYALDHRSEERRVGKDC